VRERINYTYTLKNCCYYFFFCYFFGLKHINFLCFSLSSLHFNPWNVSFLFKKLFSSLKKTEKGKWTICFRDDASFFSYQVSFEMSFILSFSDVNPPHFTHISYIFYSLLKDNFMCFAMSIVQSSFGENDCENEKLWF
jgi:hypothetical protein